ncbi:MAG: hypothetical protein ACKOWK_01715 [Micrococcales bacterium]
MSENLQDLVQQELARIAELDLTEQPEGYARLRDALEQALDALPEGN